MKNAAEYESFLTNDSSIDSYCQSTINPHATEIDHLGIKAVYDAIIGYPGIGLDIVYLDRSEGDRCNVISFGPPSRPSHRGQTICLLYRM